MREKNYMIGGIIACLWLIVHPAGSWAQPWGGERVVTVVVAPVTEAKLTSTLYLVGTAFPLISTTISAEVSGKIEQFKVDEGSFIKKNAVISQLDKKLKLIAVKRDKSLVEQARAELSKLEAGSRKEEIEQAKAQVESQKAALEKLKLNRDRMEKLYSKGMATLEEKQNAYWDHQQGLAKLSEVEALYEQIVEGPRKEEIEAAKAQLSTRQEELERVEDNLEKTTITAPFNGMIVKKHKEIGEWINESEALADIINIEKILIHTNISEKDIAEVKRGQSADVSFDALPNQKLKGTVKEIIPQADTQSRTFPVKIEVDNRNHKLYAGMFARIKLYLGKNTQVLMVPKDAMLKSDSTRYLFTVNDTKARRVEVKVGQEKGDLIEVKGNIKLGDQVVVTNNEVLRDNMKVKIVPGK
jgi:multidrug efflux pump subunit AcrA (membrane-fusion protein)